MDEIKRRAMRLAVYIRQLGADPVHLRGTDYRSWERGLQKQYQTLRATLGTEAGQAARVRGRALIRREGLSSIVADLLPVPTRAQRKQVSRANPSAQKSAGSVLVEAPISWVEVPVTTNPATCKRKYRHPHFLSAMLHARRLGSPGLQVYPCEHCHYGLHVGHDPNSEATKRARAVRKRLRSIEKQLAAIARQADELQRERRSLLSEQGVRTESAPGRLRKHLLRAGAWLRKL